jgi:hypothetical protein
MFLQGGSSKHYPQEGKIVEEQFRNPDGVIEVGSRSPFRAAFFAAIGTIARYRPADVFCSLRPDK